MESRMDEEMYVVICQKDGIEPSLCYKSSRDAFVGPYDEAKVLLTELQEWHPEEKYKIYKLSDID